MPYTTKQALTSESTPLGMHYAVRVGVHGQVGRFAASEGSYRRGTQVICRTARGLEVGQVLNGLRWSGVATLPEQLDGRIVRQMVAEDHLLWNQLKHLAQEAHGTCQRWLEESGLPDRLLEVEPLLDGRTLYFHFFQEHSAATEQQIEKLVSIFQQTVAASSFAKLLEHGCGPGCGTDQAKGCSSCTTCSVRSRCSTKPKPT